MKIILGLVMLAALITTTIASAQAAPYACSGYPEQRVYLQSEGYWEHSDGKPVTSTNDYGSVTEGTCFPVGGTLAGSVKFDIFITMHGNPGTLSTVEIQIFGSSDNKIVAKATSAQVGKKCVGQQACVFPFTLTANTNLFAEDGLQEFRFHAYVTEPDGKRLLATTGWQAFLKNGKKVQNYRPQGVNFQEARGWYTDEGYTTGRFTSPIPWAPVHGTYIVNVASVVGSGGKPVKESSVILDACSNCTPEIEGTVLRKGTGVFTGSVPIDTTKLVNGMHSLSITAGAPSTTGATLKGTLIVPFVVQN